MDLCLCHRRRIGRLFLRNRVARIMAPIASHEDADPPRESASGATTAERRLAELREVTAAALDEKTAARALEIVLDSVRLRHGALFVYNPDQQSLALVTHKGLSQQARDAVGVIRRGIGGVWDMPLHSVMQRRVYIIEKPRENPFVPVLLEGAELGLLRNVAVVPLFAAGSVTGALLLIGSGPAVIRDSDIVSLREHAKLLGTALRQAPKAARSSLHVLNRPAETEPKPAGDASARERAALTARVNELEAVVESLRRSAAEATASIDAGRRVADAVRERDRLESEAAFQEIALLNLRAELDTLRDRAAGEAERARGLEADLTAARHELAASAERIASTAAERDRVEHRHHEAERHRSEIERRLREALDHGRAAEAERTALASRFSAAEATLRELRKSLSERDVRIADLRAERERMTASLQSSATRFQEAEASLAALRENSADSAAILRTEMETLRARLEGAERERDQLRAGARGREDVVREIEHETERFRVELERETERRRAAEQTASAVLHDAAALRAELDRAVAAEAASAETAGRLLVENRRLEAESALRADEARAAAEGRERDAERLRVDLAESEERRAALAAALEGSRAEVSRRQAEEDDLRRLGAAAAEGERRSREEAETLRRRLENAADEVRTIAAERDELAQRSASLQETVSRVLHEAGAAQAKFERGQQEARRLQALDEDRTTKLRAEVEALLLSASRTRAVLEASEAAGKRQASRAEKRERQLAAIRSELERAQARSSELTLEIEERRRREELLRAAAESDPRIETERIALAAARAEIESERDAAREAVERVEEFERRAREAEQAVADAEEQAAALDAERLAAVETAERVASELGRRGAALAETSARLESIERELEETRVEREHSIERAQALEEGSRTAAAEIAKLEQQLLAAGQAAQKRGAAAEIQLGEARDRAERIAAELAGSERQHEDRQRAIAALEVERGKAEEEARAAAAAASGAEAALVQSRDEVRTLTAEIEALRLRTAMLEGDLETVEAESARWRALSDRLQVALEDREIDRAEDASIATNPAPAPRIERPPPRAAGLAAPGDRMIVVLDDEGPAFRALTEACERSGFHATLLEDTDLGREPHLVAVNLLATRDGGLAGLNRIHGEERLRRVPLVLYASKPASDRGLVLTNVSCLVRPLERADFEAAVGTLLGSGSRVTIIGEELDSVLRLNGWATSKGYSVSSAGDLKQGNEILDIVKPDLIVFDFSRLSGEGAGLVAKVRRSLRLDGLPILIVLPAGAQSPSASLFLKRLATLAEETPLDLTPLTQRLAEQGGGAAD